MTRQSPWVPWDAVVLAGGASRRMGGVDKTRLEVAGRSLLDRVLDATAGAATVVVVGPPDAVAGREVVRAREDPPGGGPLAALGAALPLIDADRVVVLAADLPFAAGLPEVLLASLAGSPHADAAVPVDGSGRRQPLAAAYRVAPLRDALSSLEPLDGGGFGPLLERVRVTDVPVHRLPPGCLRDVDTPGDLDALLDRRP